MAFKVPDNLTSATPTQKQKIKTPFARIIVSHIEDHAHFSIIWWDIQTMTMREGYSSYSFETVQKWLDEEFEIDEAAFAQLRVISRGHWILEREPDGKPYCYHCSVCDSDRSNIDITTAYACCPNCLSIMDGEIEDGTA